MQHDLVVGRASNSQDPLITPQGGIADGSGNNTAAAYVALVGNGGSPLVPAGATNVAASSGNVANATATATLPAVAGKTNYVTGFSITGGGATAAALVNATLSGVVGGPLTYTFGAPAGATTAALPLIFELETPIPGSAPNTAVSISLPALGAGNTNAAVTIHGYVV